MRTATGSEASSTKSRTGQRADSHAGNSPPAVLSHGVTCGTCGRASKFTFAACNAARTFIQLRRRLTGTQPADALVPPITGLIQGQFERQ